MSEAELRIDIIESFQALQCSIDKLESLLQHDKALPAWTDTLKDPRDAAFELIAKLEYENHQAPKEILVLPGFIGASEQTIAQVKIINTNKAKFKANVLALRGSQLKQKDAFLNASLETYLNQRREKHTRTSLQKMGLARLHLKQCYRIIPILDAVPLSISWTWANTRSIKRISRQEAISKLEQRNKTGKYELQLHKLYGIRDKELAIIQELAPHLRTNIILPTAEKNETKRIMLKGPVPIFFPASEATIPPKFKSPKEKSTTPEERAVRSDVKINPEPFISAIRAHRYFEYEDRS